MAVDELQIELHHRMPWLNAEGESWWRITGRDDRGRILRNELATVVPPDITGYDSTEREPLFQMFAWGGQPSYVPASRVTRARRLVLVHADDPSTAVDGIGQDYLDASSGDGYV